MAVRRTDAASSPPRRWGLLRTTRRLDGPNHGVPSSSARQPEPAVPAVFRRVLRRWMAPEVFHGMDKSIHGSCGLTSRSYLQAVAKPINSSHEYFSTPETSQVTTGILSIRQKHDNTRAEAVLALPHERFSCQLLCYCLGVLCRLQKIRTSWFTCREVERRGCGRARGPTVAAPSTQ
jgi:hypothetical protein